MALDDESVQILGQIAAIAGSYGLYEESEAIVSGLRAISPDDENFLILHAMSCISGDRLNQAKSILTDEVLAKNPTNLLAQSLLGLVYHLKKDMAARDTAIQEPLDAGEVADEDAFAIASELKNS